MLIFAVMVHNEHFFNFVSALYKTEPSHIKGFGLKSSVTVLKKVFYVIVLERYYNPIRAACSYLRRDLKKANISKIHILLIK